MIKFNQFLTNKRFKSWRIFSAGVILCLCLIFAWGVGWSRQAATLLKRGQLQEAGQAAGLAYPVATVLNTVSLHLNPDLQFWQLSLELVYELPNLAGSGRTYLTNAVQNLPSSPTEIQAFKSSLTKISEQIPTWEATLPHSWLYHHFIVPKLPKTALDQLLPNSQLSQTLALLPNAVDEVMTGQHRYIILFQNSDELRATGGFIGSYAVVEVNNGSIAPLQFFDIYDADGQVVTPAIAPPGLAEYLSGGQGMRLPNANWNPDFPSSAQTILQLFAQSSQTNTQHVDGVIALNLSVIQQLLQITGPIQITESNVTVSADNLSTVARADRANYFPGSKQKKNFLQSLATQLRLTLVNLTPAQRRQLATRWISDLTSKDLQFFFHQPNLAKVSQVWQATGQVTTGFANLPPSDYPPAYLMLIESNVGINKANQKISRSIQVALQDTQLHLKIQFANQNPYTTHLGKVDLTNLRENPYNDYINYQRVLLPAGSTADTIAQDGHPITKIDTNDIVTASGEHFQQVGFLVAVPETLHSEVTLDATLPNSFQLNPTLILQKQAGLTSTPFTLYFGQQLQTLLLDQDKVIQFLP